jgi:peptidoglycan-associated lipoprotein
MKGRNMKVNKFANLLVIGLVLCVAASGCKKKPVNVTELPGSKAGKAPELPAGGGIKPAEPLTGETGASGTSGATSATGETGGHASNPANLHEGWLEDAQALKAETVLFDFDSSVIKASEKPKAAAVADYLKANKGKAVRVEGNCDERGTEEYNRSLGERRALALREELIRLGIGPTEVDTISYGKDKPTAQGHDESAWRQNRRDDFIVLTKPGS